MSREFLNGMISERAKIASSLTSEVLADIPDHMLEKHQEALSKGAQALLEIYHTLRAKDKP